MTAATPTRSGCPDTWLAEALGQLPAGGCRGDRPPTIRVGVDLVAVADVMESVERFGDRYIQRIFTSHEIACCRSDLSPRDPALRYSFESLAARFAAKEATVKVLRPVGPRPEWRSIEVFRTEGGWCEIRLRGRASALADRAGIDRWAVSLTHEAAMAAAVVVGVGRGDSAGDDGASSDRGEG
jgi:holo-[acyl-carrier protein] synthase